jgi:hypothetical protein
MSEPIAVVDVCGPSTKRCKCRCPESCEHKWDGPEYVFDGGGSSTCSRCGLTAIQHDLWVGP